MLQGKERVLYEEQGLLLLLLEIPAAKILLHPMLCAAVGILQEIKNSK